MPVQLKRLSPESSGTLQFGDNSTADSHQFIWFNRKVVVPRARCRPHFVVLQQIGIDEDAQLSAVAERRHATFGLGNSRERLFTSNPALVP